MSTSYLSVGGSAHTRFAACAVSRETADIRYSVQKEPDVDEPVPFGFQITIRYEFLITDDDTHCTLDEGDAVYRVRVRDVRPRSCLPFGGRDDR